MTQQRYPPPRVIAVDVDGTLCVDGEPNAELIAWLRKQRAAGFVLNLWSSRGEAHAREVAEAFGVAELFAAIISKPGYIVDDVGWSWIRYTRLVTSFEISEADNADDAIASDAAPTAAAEGEVG